ncbi:hypothetical protein CBR_g4444 [Chara braunii]|uniref:Glycosyl transferase family 25 domain-containing protein n=1 Tax=Chara braunii TaxID=69332 RepID=A0A388KI15_CHABU|nr:hypothetical protein CBR_g4444 [Chara braunii]|eukprot:GBG69613.1 hypothetical protein CBR_g4444 [Chara braunii]
MPSAHHPLPENDRGPEEEGGGGGGGGGGGALPPALDGFGFLKTSSGALGHLFFGGGGERREGGGGGGGGGRGGGEGDGGLRITTDEDENVVDIYSLEMNPVTRTDLGLFPSLELWPADRVFVVSGGKTPSRGSLMMDDLLHSAGMKYTRVVVPQDDSLVARQGPGGGRYPDGTVEIPPPTPDGGEEQQQLQQYRSRLRVLAHVELWAMALRKDVPFVMIFDDDTVFNPSPSPSPFKAHLEKCLRQLIFLELQQSVRFRPSFDVCLLARWPLADFGEPDLTEDIVEAKASRGAGAYILSREGARELLRKVTGAKGEDSRLLKGQMGGVMMLGEGGDPPPFGNAGGLACRPTGASRTSANAAAGKLMTSTKKRRKGGGGGGVDDARREKVMREEEEEEEEENNKKKKKKGGEDVQKKSGCDWNKAERRRTALLLRIPAMVEDGDAISRSAVIRNPCGVSVPRGLGGAGVFMPPPSPPRWTRVPESPSDWPLFVINLASMGERIKSLMGSLGSLGFRRAVRAVGIPAGDPEMEVFKGKVSAGKEARTRTKWKSGKRFLSRGEVGCALSHYLVWLEVVANGIPFAMIVEDDVVFSASFSEIFSRAMAELNGLIDERSISAKFDVCLLGRKMVVEPRRESPPRVSPTLVYATPSWQTHAYLVSLEGAEKLVASFFVNDPLDTFWWRMPDARFLAIDPALVGQSSTEGMSVSSTQFGSDTPW